MRWRPHSSTLLFFYFLSGCLWTNASNKNQPNPYLIFAVLKISCSPYRNFLLFFEKVFNIDFCGFLSICRPKRKRRTELETSPGRTPFAARNQKKTPYQIRIKAPKVTNNHNVICDRCLQGYQQSNASLCTESVGRSSAYRYKGDIVNNLSLYGVHCNFLLFALSCRYAYIESLRNWIVQFLKLSGKTPSTVIGEINSRGNNHTLRGLLQANVSDISFSFGFTASKVSFTQKKQLSGNS